MRFFRPAVLGVCTVALALAAGRAGHHVVALAADGKSAPAARDPQAVTPQEWVEIIQWMQQVRPAQYKVLNAMGDGPQKEKAKQLIAEKYRQIKRINYAPLRDAVIAEARAQDDLFGAELKFRIAKRSGVRANRLDEARAEVQAAVANLFDAQIAEKRVRVDRLQNEIDRMQKNKTTYVANWTNGITNQPRTSSDAIKVAPPETSPGDSDSPGSP